MNPSLEQIVIAIRVPFNSNSAGPQQEHVTVTFAWLLLLTTIVLDGASNLPLGIKLSMTLNVTPIKWTIRIHLI